MSNLDDIGPDGLTAAQRAAGYAPRKHSVAAGLRQSALAEPLTEAELRTGGGYGPAITDVDCTPRPRYGESQAKFLARMASYGADVEVLKREVRQRNRAAALRVVLRSGSVERWESVEAAVQAGRVGIDAYFTQCACGWCGLRVADPEVARREYDAHTCAAESIGDDAVSRAQAHAGKATMPPRRTAAVLKPAPEPETIEVPVTRRARVTLVGRLEWSRSWMSAGILNETGEPLFLEPGARFVLRPYEGAPFRAGLGNVLSDGRLILGEIPAACHGDLVYRVEPS